MNCKWFEVVLALLIIVFALWQTSYSMWVIVISAALLLIHALMCNVSHVHHGKHRGKR